MPERALRVGALVVGVVLCTAPLGSLADPGRGGSADVELSPAEAHATVSRPWHVPTRVLRRAIFVVERARLCAASSALVSIVDDAHRDVLTRALAALALGELACRVERGHRRDGLDAEARGSLESATLAGGPAGLRQAATRALGRARSFASEAALTPLRDADTDPVVRFLAAQALTRITESDQFDAPLRDALVAQYLTQASGYELVEMTP